MGVTSKDAVTFLLQNNSYPANAGSTKSYKGNKTNLALRLPCDLAALVSSENAIFPSEKFEQKQKLELLAGSKQKSIGIAASQ